MNEKTYDKFGYEHYRVKEGEGCPFNRSIGRKKKECKYCHRNKWCESYEKDEF